MDAFNPLDRKNAVGYDSSAIDPSVLNDIAMYMGVDPEDENGWPVLRIPKSVMDDISASGEETLLDAFLRYNGIIGYTRMIINALDSIRGAERPAKYCEHCEQWHRCAQEEVTSL